MGLLVSRMTDIGIGLCRGHGRTPMPMAGMLIGTSATITTEFLPNGLVVDMVLGACGHVGIMVTSAATVIGEGRPVLRMGDLFVGTFSGVLVGCCGTVTAT